ncbi:MAG: molybdopterin-dependent oxidoreductase [Sporichthyaceae bacterium]
MATVARTCPLCEATCGLSVTLDPDGSVVDIRGDTDDVFSAGFICPKGVALKGLHTDPDRLHTPLVRRGGALVEASWGEAFAEVADRLPAILRADGPDAVAVFSGSAVTHALGPILYTPALIAALGTTRVFSAASLHARARQVAAGLMYGDPTAIAVPDIDRTDFLLMLGANPAVSNGGMLTAPDLRARLRAVRRRGGRVVVVDPRRSATAESADEHLFIRPGTDPLLLLALLNVLVAEDRFDLGANAGLVEGVESIAGLASAFTPSRVAERIGISPDPVRRLARDLAGSSAGVVYGHIGVATGPHATLTAWLIDVLNIVTGNLDSPGGAMFPCPGHRSLVDVGFGAHPLPFSLDAGRTRVRGLPVVCGEYPSATLAEEIDTPGPGRIRALITVGGNPMRSVPNSGRMRAALGSLELMVCVDSYVNETSALADVVLPVPSVLERSHYDLIHYQFACRNTANYSAPALPMPLGMNPEWETLLRLAAIAATGDSTTDLSALDEAWARQAAARLKIDLADVPGDLRGPERLVDLLLRAGPYDLTLEHLQFSPHGLDLGALEPRLRDVVATVNGRVHLAPADLMAAGRELRDSLDAPPDRGLLLIGRRHLRSNNSWLHNLPTMIAGARRCTLQVNETDAYSLGLRNGGRALVTSATGQVVASVEINAEIAPGLVSLPHGWGHDEPQARLRVAAERPGVNANVLTDDAVVDLLSGNAVLSAVPVTVSAHAGDAPEGEQPMPDRRSGLDRRRRREPGTGMESFGPA